MSVQDIERGIAGGRGSPAKRALLLSPAIYTLTRPLAIHADGFVLLGIGFPTLIATGGDSALVVTGRGVRISGVLLEAGTSVAAPPSAPLLLWAGSEGVGSDVFTRSGAFKYATALKPSCMRTRADVHVAIAGDAVTLDNTWAWHADHDDCGGLSDRSYVTRLRSSHCHVSPPPLTATCRLPYLAGTRAMASW